MASEWFSYPLLQSRESVKLLLVRNEEVLSASAKEAGCSVQQLKLAMGKYHVMTEKERETMTAVEARLFMMLRAEARNWSTTKGRAAYFAETAGAETEGRTEGFYSLISFVRVVVTEVRVLLEKSADLTDLFASRKKKKEILPLRGR